jgi:hypothetical protein
VDLQESKTFMMENPEYDTQESLMKVAMRSLLRLKEACELLKCQLSKREEVKMNLGESLKSPETSIHIVPRKKLM